MKNPLAALLLACLAVPVLAQTSHYVRPHVDRNGTYVQGHQQTNPDNTRVNNWSSAGQTNPTTGQPGRVDPYAPPTTYKYIGQQGYANPIQAPSPYRN